MINYFFVLFLVTYSLTFDNTSTFEVSMVSSQTDREQPALFDHAESPVWDERTQSLYFVDALRQNVHRLDYASGNITTKHIGYGQVNVVSLVADTDLLLVAVRAGLYLLDWHVSGDASIRLLSTVDEGLPDNVINEGKADVEGRFWAGTKGPQTNDDVVPDKASFYSFSPESMTHPKCHLRPVSISNGLVWSLNNSRLYYIDSSTQKIEAFDFDPCCGEISGRRTIMNVYDIGYEDAIPDGMTIDDQGNLWVALMFGGTILHINPDTRRLINEYKLPASRTTSVAWAGPNLDELYITTSQDRNNASEPLAGAIFIIRGTGYRGVLPHYFRYKNCK